MLRIRFAAATVLAASLALLAMLILPTPANRLGSPARWYEQFWSLSSDYRRQAGEEPSPSALVRIAGFTSEIPPRLIIHVECPEAAKRRSHQEIWVADVDGTAPSRLVDEPGMVISAVEPAPGGSRIVYVARPDAAPTLAESWAAARIGLVDGTKGSRVIAADGAIAPAWTADGHSILLLRRVEGGWQPNRIDLSHPAALPQPVADLIFAVPPDLAVPAARFSPDGRAVAGFHEWELVVARLEAGHPPRRFPAVAGRTVGLSWSPDSAWLRLAVETGGPSWPPTMGLALRVADGEQINVAGSLGIIGKPSQDERVWIVSATWMPGPGHRLLVLAYRGEPLSDNPLIQPGVDPIRERRWLIHDLDAGTTKEVVGPSTEEPGPTDSREIHVSLDGRYLGAGPSLDVLDAAR